MEWFNANVWPIIQPLLYTVVLPLLLAFASRLVIAGYSKMPANIRGIIKDVVGTSVAAVEQAFPDYSAVEKKAKAEEFIQRQLGAHGLHISNDVLDPLIEEAVLALHLVIADDSKPMTGFTSSPSVVPQAATNKK